VPHAGYRKEVPWMLKQKFTAYECMRQSVTSDSVALTPLMLDELFKLSGWLWRNGAYAQPKHKHFFQNNTEVNVLQ